MNQYTSINPIRSYRGKTFAEALKLFRERSERMRDAGLL